MKDLFNIATFFFLCLSTVIGQETNKTSDSIRYDVKEIFKVVQKMPMFGGCETKECTKAEASKFIQDNLVYPEKAIELGLEDTIETWFVIDVDGIIESASVRGKSKSVFAQSSEEVIMKMNTAEKAWTPGYQRGIPVRVLLKIPIEYSL